MGTPGGAVRGGSARRKRAVLALACAAGALATASAQAQLESGGDPGETVDTPYTPVPKPPPENLFHHVSGPQYDAPVPRRERMVEGSPADFDDDLRDVAFYDEDRGIAAGARNVEGGTRPVIYNYTLVDGWRRTFLDEQGPGYVAAVAWIDSERALAVGGDGRYPEREREGEGHCLDGKQPSTDPLDGGRARAWIYEDGEWRELRNLTGADDGAAGDEMPDAMTALTALDFYRPDPARPIEFGIAGGLCQIWHWTDGGFWRTAKTEWQEPFSVHGTPSTKFAVAGIAHRVRQIKFTDPVEELEPAMRRPRAYAVLGGCCASERSEPKAVVYRTPNDHKLDPCDHPWQPSPCSPPWQSAHDAAVAGGWSATSLLGEPTPNQLTSRRELEPDSYVAVTARVKHNPNRNDLPLEFIGPGGVATTTGPVREGPSEPPPRVGGRSIGHSSVDLADADGDTGGGRQPLRGAITWPRIGGYGLEPQLMRVGLDDRGPGPKSDGGEYYGSSEFYPRGPQYTYVGGEEAVRDANGQPVPDGVPDWSVGVRRSNGQGTVYATDPTQLAPPGSALKDPEPVAYCVGGNPLADIVFFPSTYFADQARCNAEQVSPNTAGGLRYATEDEPLVDAEGTPAALRSYKLLALPTYGLNAIDFLDADGLGWIVGDHGTLVKMTLDREAVRRAREPEPPQFHSRAEQSPPEREAFGGDGWRATGEPGLVPPLRAQPRTAAEREPRLHLEDSFGNKGGNAAIARITMSATGEEGWASGGGLLYHYDGRAWTRCVRDERGDLPGDPACHGVIELADEEAPVFDAGVRVPGADGFEVVALGGPVGVMRYSAGRWRPEDPEALSEVGGNLAKSDVGSRKLLHVAFSAPDHGWIAVSDSTTADVYRLFRFDGEKWRSCRAFATSAPDSCDPHGRLPRSPLQGELKGLVAAGERVYAYGDRQVRTTSFTGTVNSVTRRFPFITYHERGDATWSAEVRDDEYDPGRGTGDDPLSAAIEQVVGPVDRNAADSGKALVQQYTRPAGEGSLTALTVSWDPEAGYSGWAAGRMGSEIGLVPSGGVLRLSEGRWEPFADTGVARDLGHALGSGALATTSTGGGRSTAFLARPGNLTGDLWRFDPGDERFEVVPSERPPAHGFGGSGAGVVHALAPDGEGGLWLSIGMSTFGEQFSYRSFVYRYTNRPRAPVFEEVPYPSSTPHRHLRALAATRTGTVWAATNSDMLFRYDRAAGWDSIRIPGWDPPRTTAPSAAEAIDVNESGEGVVVGRNGRIARFSDRRVGLDPAAGRICDIAPVAPCATSYDLRAAAVAEDGAAVVAGAGRSVLFRPPGGDFRRVAAPPVAPTAIFTDAEALADGSFLLVSAKKAFHGTRSGDDLSWRLDSVGADGEPLPVERVERDASGAALALHDGRVYEREGAATWRPVEGGTGAAAIFGGRDGEISTLTSDGLEVARPRVFPSGRREIPDIRATLVVPGLERGEVEAWAITDAPYPGFGQLLHFSSDSDEPLLNPAGDVEPLPDAPAARPGELAFAAFGRTECHPGSRIQCPLRSGDTEYSEQVFKGIVEELWERTRGPAGVSFALFTGDAVDQAGFPGNEPAEGAVGPTANFAGLVTSAAGPAKLRRWGMMVPDELREAGMPTFGAIGGQDLSDVAICLDGPDSCESTKRTAATGENLAWRQAMTDRLAPWGTRTEESRLEFRAAPGSPGEHWMPDAAVDPDGSEGQLPERRVPAGGAPTHYAVDVVDPSRDPAEVARIVVIDSSLGALAANDPIQQPVEPSGQLAWLEQMICVPGAADAQRCTRKPHQRAIVVSNAPTYSYGPGAITGTLAEAAAVEALLLEHRVDALVAGRIGWNGHYWITAAGVHHPCPGGDYPESPPEAGELGCAETPTPSLDGEALDEAGALGEALTGADAPVAMPDAEPEREALRGPIPAVVASSSGGRFAQGNEGDLGETGDGFWSGYTVVRLDPDGDPARTVVEQRPVWDWIAIEAQERALRPGQRMTLRGYARGPFGDKLRFGSGQQPMVRFDRIDSAAVTHRYDLLVADPARPWLPYRDANGDYVPLPTRVATVHRQSGLIRAGRGTGERTHAVALLSVGDRASAYPLLFEPRRSFVGKRQRVLLPPAVRAARAPAAQPPVRIPQAPPPPAPPPAAPGAPLTTQALQPPQPVEPPFLAPAAPPSAPAPPALDAPPPPPPPPPAQVPPPHDQPLPLALGAKPQAIAIVPSVNPPAPPPVNPAPPAGSAARKEAKQRQAASAKSEEGGGDAAPDAKGLGGDKAAAPESAGYAATRRSTDRPGRSFTALRPAAQASGWSRTPLYGGGLTLAALALAAAWSILGPRPRRREPRIPAAAWSRASRRDR